MTTKIRMGIAGITFLMMAGLVYTASASFALEGADLPKTVKDIAAAFKKGDAAGAKKLAAATAKNPKLIDDIGDLMLMYRPSDKGGLGLENSLKKATLKNADELAYLTIAMAELTVTKGWDKPNAKRTKKAWNDFSEELRAAGEELAKAKNAKSVAEAATKVNNVCGACHLKFKD